MQYLTKPKKTEKIFFLNDLKLLSNCPKPLIIHLFFSFFLLANIF
ncbi:hypothetical protein M33023_01030 [Candidatus Phytoplasma asteris]|uniref:Uncharacterized protein n=1 Tax=Candidatus Phytoplasma asteris TaxID=85620 RepID=A0ABZ2YEH0_9MOLU